MQHFGFRKLRESDFGVPFWLKLVALFCAYISIYVQIAAMSKMGLMGWLAGLGAVLQGDLGACWLLHGGTQPEDVLQEHAWNMLAPHGCLCHMAGLGVIGRKCTEYW